MRLNNFVILQIIKKNLIILIILVFANNLVGDLYTNYLFPDPDIDYSGWLTFGINTALASLSIYLINRDNFVGDMIALYMSYNDLDLAYNVLNGFFSFRLFQIGSQLIFTEIADMAIIVLLILHCLLIILKQIKPNLFISNSNLSQNKSFIKKHQLDLIIICIFVLFIFIYWFAWEAVK